MGKRAFMFPFPLGLHRLARFTVLTKFIALRLTSRVVCYGNIHLYSDGVCIAPSSCLSFLIHPPANRPSCDVIVNLLLKPAKLVFCKLAADPGRSTQIKGRSPLLRARFRTPICVALDAPSLSLFVVSPMRSFGAGGIEPRPLSVCRKLYVHIRFKFGNLGRQV